MSGTSSQSKLDERELVARMRAGDELAFEEVVRAFGPSLLALARRFLQHDQDAQDALQDAFLSAFKNLDQFAENSQFSTWLHRITVNAALMKLRRRRAKPERSIDDLLPRFTDDGHLSGVGRDWHFTEDRTVADRETRELVRRSIDQLPDSYRTVLLLRDIEQHSTDETADLIGISTGAVKTRLHRARQALRSLLGQNLPGGLA